MKIIKSSRCFLSNSWKYWWIYRRSYKTAPGVWYRIRLWSCGFQMNAMEQPAEERKLEHPHRGENEGMEIYRQSIWYGLSETQYINGDDADWFKAECGMIAKSHFVLDKYHLTNRINVATAHLLDSSDDAKAAIYEAINGKDRKELKKAFQRLRI